MLIRKGSRFRSWPMTASSGTKKYTKMVITTTNPAKKKKRPNFMWQSMARNACAMMKVKNMLTDTLTAWPADLTSRGQISLGTSHPNGPQDHAKAATYAQIKNSSRSASVFVKDPSPVTPNFNPIMAPTAIYGRGQKEVSCTYLANDHLDTTFKEQSPPSKRVYCENRYERCKNIDNPTYGCRHERSLGTESQCLEENRGIEHDNVNASELLEEGNEGADHKLRAVSPLKYVLPWVIHFLGSFTGSK